MNKMSKSLAKILLAALICIFMVDNSFAGFDGGGPISGGGGSCAGFGNYRGWGYCHGYDSWYFYEYNSNTDYGEVTVAATTGLPDSYSPKDITISAECDSYSSGIYVSGITVFNDAISSGWHIDKMIDTDGGVKKADLKTREGKKYTWDGRPLGFEKYNSKSVYYNGVRRVLNDAPLASDGTLTLKATYIVPNSEVQDRWNGYDGKRAAKELASESGKSDDLSDYSWFCAGDVQKAGQNYKGSALIKVNSDNSSDFSGNGDAQHEYTDSGNGGTSVKKNQDSTDYVLTITKGGDGSTLGVSVEAYGKVQANGGIPSGYDKGYTKVDFTVKASSGSDDIIEGAHVDDRTTTSDWVATGKPKTNVSLVAGVIYTICADNNYASTYRSDAGGYGDYKTVKACVKVKYEPVVAEIDSTTSLSVNGKYIATSDPDSSSSNVIEEKVNYGENALSAEWGYTLYSKARCYDGDFDQYHCNPARDISNKFTIGYKRIGDAHSDGSVLTKELNESNRYTADPAPESNKQTYTLFPGETISKAQSIQHQSGVYTNGASADGSKPESSSVSFTATAKNIVCNINSLEFGYDNPYNYGRMHILRNASTQKSYGDGSMNGWSGTVWFKPDDNIKLGYEACIGEQILKDKNSGKAWSEISKKDEDNVVLPVTIENGDLDTQFDGNSTAISKDGTKGKDIIAYEAIGETINAHANDYNYQFGTIWSKEGLIGNLGHSIGTKFGNLKNGTVDVKLKIPFNYNLEPSSKPTGSGEIATIGDTTNFEVRVRRSERTNKQVDAKYATDVKSSTVARYVAFRLPTSYSPESLQQWADEHKTWDGNVVTNYYGDTLSGFIHASMTIDPIEEGEIPIDDINNNKVTKIPVSTEGSNADYNKICVAVGVYPGDSHNVKEGDIDDTAQSIALSNEPGDGAYSRISVSCKTVGKYPSMSAEGNGIVSRGETRGSYTEYKDRRFGSWSEYGLVANSVTNFASGASVAYLNAQNVKNESSDFDQAGENKDYFDSPQTTGNISSNIGLQDSAEASVYADQMNAYADNIKTTFFTEDYGAGEPPIKQINDTTYINTNYKGDVKINWGLANNINALAESGQVIIYSAGNIEISNDVEELDAILIADGYVDTCAEDSQHGDNGQLLTSCNKRLFVNGVVFSNGDIKLDRVYGGGSIDGLNLDSRTLVQRAEVFDFDSRTVKWSYDYMHANQPLMTTYIEELSTRY